MTKTQSALTVSPLFYHLHSSNTLLCESPPPCFLQSSCLAPCGTCSCKCGRYFRTEGRKLCRISPDSPLRRTLLLSKVKFITLANYITNLFPVK